jgi:polyvinyl alcohol dehydrogenase (cytochrome)
MFARVGVLCVGFIALAVPALAQQAPNGEAVFKQSCATCHREGQSDAPTRDALRQMTPESIYNAQTLGRMILQASALSDDERKAVAVFLSGRAFAPPSPLVVVNRCTSSPAMRDPSSAGGWNGWGNGVANTRFQSAANGGLTAADLPKLKLKWAFGYSVVTSARAQPIVAGGRLFVASENMEIHALDPKTGCTHWSYKAQAGVRTALSAGPYKGAAGSGYAV